MFIKAAHIHLNAHRGPLLLPGCANEREGDLLKFREMLIFNYAFSLSRDWIMWAALMKRKV